MEFSSRRIFILPGLLALPPADRLTELELREHNRLDVVLPGQVVHDAVDDSGGCGRVVEDFGPAR